MTATSWAATGQLLQLEASTGNGRKTWVTHTYDEGTNRLTETDVKRSGQTAADVHRRYEHDPVGNILSIAETAGPRETQCFTLDALRRLSEAWITASDAAGACATAPSATTVGGPAPYWQSFTYDDGGSRLTETLHGVGGLGTVEREYQYPDAGEDRPHTLTRVVEQSGSTVKNLDYAYDDTGNTLSRPGSGTQQQALTWDADGRLATVTEAGQTTTNIYDAEGKRLLRKAQDANTLYLPMMELRLDKATNTVSATRMYSLGGAVSAVRTAGQVNFVVEDFQGTQIAAVDAATGTFQRRRFTPFGGPRGAATPAFPGGRGYLGRVADDGGLTALGARMYDASLGRFISADPIVDYDDSQQIHGYAYANNSPISFSDPNGLRHEANETFTPALPNYNQWDVKKRFHTDDAERAATLDAARAKAIRDRRKQQIKNDRKFEDLLFWAQDVADDMVSGGKGRGGGWGRLAREFVEELTEDLLVDIILDDVLSRIDESAAGKGSPDDRHGTLEYDKGAFDNDEFTLAFILARDGHNVVAKSVDYGTAGNSKDNFSFDAWVDGVRSEFKTLEPGSGERAVKNAMKHANEQHAERIYFHAPSMDGKGPVQDGMRDFVNDRKSRPGATTLKEITVYGDGWMAPTQTIDFQKGINCKGWDFWEC